jgi:hypothetical protein
MRDIWKVIERDGKKGKWALPYVSLSPDGEIRVTRVAWEQSGSPEAYLVMFDDRNQRIGLKGTVLGAKNAYKTYKSGTAGSRTLSCNRMLVEHGIKLEHGIRFTDIEIQQDGFIILDLRTAVTNKASTARHRRRESTN